MAKSIAIVFIIVAGLYAVGTMNRNNFWKDSFILWSNTVKKSPDSADAHNNLGIQYADRGLFDKAVEEYQTALLLKPDYPDALNNLGVAYADQGQLDKAIAEFQRVLRLKPNSIDAHFNLALIYWEKGNADLARREVEVVLNMQPNLPEARQLLNDIVSRRH